MRLILRLLVLLAVAASVFADAPQTTTILIVRHAPQVSTGEDPELTEEGAARARSLGRLAKEANVSAIYTTQYRRTRDTGAPAAEATKAELTPVTFDKGVSLDDYSAALAKRILGDHQGETILVVGHSNTVPGLVKALTGETVPPIAHTEFDRLYVVEKTGDLPAKLTAKTY